MGSVAVGVLQNKVQWWGGIGAVASSSAHLPHQELHSKSPASPSANERTGERQTDGDTHSSLHPSEIPVAWDVSTSSPWTRQRIRHCFWKAAQGCLKVCEKCMSKLGELGPTLRLSYMRMRSPAVWPRSSLVHFNAGFKVFVIFVLDFLCKASCKKMTWIANVADSFPAFLATVLFFSQLRSHAGIYFNTKKHSGRY